MVFLSGIIAGVPPKLGTERTSVILDKVVERKYKKPVPREIWVNPNPIEEDQPWLTMHQCGPDPVAMDPFPMATGNPFGQFPMAMNPMNPMHLAPSVPPVLPVLPVLPAPTVCMGGGVAVPSAQFVPKSPEYSPTSPRVRSTNLPSVFSDFSGYDRPTSPAYDPEKPPLSPMSPAYSPRPDDSRIFTDFPVRVTGLSVM